MSGHLPGTAARWLRATAAAATVFALGTGLSALPAAAGSVHTSEWALATLHADQTWRYGKGAGVTVAVVGTGVDVTHPDLAGQVTTGTDFGDGSSQHGTQDSSTDDGQGTHVASIIAADGANFHGDGLYGIAPRARLLPVGVLARGAPSVTATAQALRWAADHRAGVIDVAVGFHSPDAQLRSAVAYALGRGAVIVTGAGDDGASGNQPTYPAAFPGVIAVAATDQHGALWPASHHSSAVLLAAPGVDILSAARDGSYWTGNGTQYAAAWVAGSAALLRSAHPSWTGAQVVSRLAATANPHGSPGRDPGYGYGIVNPAAALADQAAPQTQLPATTGSRASSTPVNATVPASAGGHAVAHPPSGGRALEIALLLGAAAIAGLLVTTRQGRRPPGRR
jgi:type VII secretion-associated serine protease mycosin